MVFLWIYQSLRFCKNGFRGIWSFRFSTASVLKLMDTVDNYIKLPPRKNDAPFLLPVETVLVAKGRGTVVTVELNKGL